MIQKLKGTKDILPEEIKKWQYIENIAKSTFETYGYEEIRVPIIEKTELFQRGVGNETDVVQKEMYVFLDKAGRSIALRPEGTAGVVRSYIENGMSSKVSPIKLWYSMPMYRYENVQKGRQREFHQIGVELFGSNSYLADSEMIEMVNSFFRKLNIKDIKLKINSIGCKNCRNDYIEALKNYIRPNLDKYCDICKTRFEKNAMRILDCKEENCIKLNQNAPKTIDYLCDECKNHFENLKKSLTDLGIDFEVDSGIVRGLDYYTKTVFEFVSTIDGLTVLGGGRYDDLVKELGGENTPAIGFATGVERLVDVFDSNNPDFNRENNLTLYIATIGEDANIYASNLVAKLRDKGIYAEKDIMERSLNAQFKYANKKNAKYVITIGDEELKSKKVELKDMATGDTKTIDIEDIEENINN